MSNGAFRRRGEKEWHNYDVCPTGKLIPISERENMPGEMADKCKWCEQRDANQRRSAGDPRHYRGGGS